MAQTYPHWECILVDDGSTDHPIEIVETVNDPRIRFFRFEENKGRGAARQYALDMAQGDYLCMLDADDWLYPDKLLIQVKIMETVPDIAVLSAGMAIVDENNEIVGIRTKRGGEAIRCWPKLEEPRFLPIAYAPSAIRMAVAKSVAHDESFKLGEDSDFLLKILLAWPFAALTEAIYAYNEIQSMSIEKLKEASRNNRRMLLKYRKEYPYAVCRGVGISILKEIVYRTAYAAGFGSRLIYQRSRQPTEVEIQKFRTAYKAVWETHQSLYSGTNLVRARHIIMDNPKKIIKADN